ncbi:MAG: alpha-L-rhamnosidase N-terminal domain-containing protein, partial [Spartobacteria bacterium]
KLSPEAVADARLLNLGGLGWHQAKDGKPGAVSCFRKSFEIPADRKVRRAVLVLYAYHFCEAAVNGTAIGSSAHWQSTARLDATKALHPGKNLVTLAVSHTDPYPPAVIGKLVVQFESGPDEIVPIDKTWKAAQSAGEGWQSVGFDDTAWNEAVPGGYTFGIQADLDRVPAPYLRKNFEVGGKVKRAMVYVTALGSYELRLNGKKVGDDVLAPGWPEFRKRVHYQTYDVTGQLQPGANTIGAILGDGWYASNLAHLCRRKFYGGNTRFLAQLVVEMEDGTKQVVATDADWKASYGPIRHADLQLGCEYDSRLEMPGWDTPGFDDSGWNPVDANPASSGQKDVLAVVAAAVKDGKVSLPVNNVSMGGDPAQNAVKV